MVKNENQKIKERYNRVAPIYDKLEYMMEKGKMGDWRENLWDKVANNLPVGEGKLLEAGVGTGKNIPYYPSSIEITAIDFSEKMLAQARKRAVEVGKEVKLMKMDIQHLDFPDNHFDIIVTSCVFCSVPDPIAGLKELRRVLQDDGRIIMLEHMKAGSKPLGFLMDAFNWVSLYTWGANINRETINNIKKADLKIVEENNLWSDIVKELVLAK